MTGVFISFQVTVNVLKVFLQYIESDEFKEEFGDDVHLQSASRLTCVSSGNIKWRSCHPAREWTEQK